MVDQLKITVDATQVADGDIPSLRRGVQQSYELQMILFEIFTNMMVHSGASHAIVEANYARAADGMSISIDISDNGTGFSVENTTGGGRGITDMKARADKLGATLTISSRPGETWIKIALSGPVVSDCTPMASVLMQKTRSQSVQPVNPATMRRSLDGTQRIQSSREALR